MNKYVRDHLLIPIGIPIAVLVGMGFLIVNISRIFLTLSATAAVVAGTGLAVAFLFGCAYAASPRHRKRSKVGVAMLVILGLGAGIAGAWAADRGERKIEKHAADGEHPPKGSPSPGEADVVVEIVAKGIEFDKAALSFPAGKTVDVHLRNDDAAIHNWSMYRDKGLSDEVFRGDTFSGPNADKHYLFTAPGAGTYYFKCDVHPDMRGTVEVT